MEGLVLEAEGLFEQAVEWLRANYEDHRFYVERDIVRLLQNRISEAIERGGLSYRVIHEYTISDNCRADLVILDRFGSLTALQSRH